MKNLGALLGGLVAGIFVGATGATIVHRKPELIKEASRGARGMLSSFAEAFREGYNSQAAKKRLASGADSAKSDD
jgi:hypothetical protein